MLKKPIIATKEVMMADNSKRGLASADESTRKKVAKKGGQASHGGGRKSESSDEQ